MFIGKDICSVDIRKRMQSSDIHANILGKNIFIEK